MEEGCENNADENFTACNEIKNTGLCSVGYHEVESNGAPERCDACKEKKKAKMKKKPKTKSAHR